MPQLIELPYQVVGRALLQAGFVSGEVIRLTTQGLPCSIADWQSDYQEYRATHHPSVLGSLTTGALKYRLAQFLRKAKTDLSCLDGDIQQQLDTLKAVVSDDIDRTARGVSQSVGHHFIG